MWPSNEFAGDEEKLKKIYADELASLEQRPTDTNRDTKQRHKQSAWTV